MKNFIKLVLLVIVGLIILCFPSTHASELEFKDFVNQLKVEIKDTNIVFIEQSFCDARGISGQYVGQFASEFNVNGKIYLFEANTLILCKGYWRSASEKEKLRTLIHELGHAFWHKRLTGGQYEGQAGLRDEFTALHDDSSKDHDYYRAYGKTNDHEDFATVFESLLFNFNDSFNYPGNLLNKKRDMIKGFISLQK